MSNRIRIRKDYADPVMALLDAPIVPPVYPSVRINGRKMQPIAFILSEVFTIRHHNHDGSLLTKKRPYTVRELKSYIELEW